MKRILVISNCQVQPLAHSLSIALKDVEIEQAPVHLHAPADRRAFYQPFVDRKHDFDLVLSVRLSDEFEQFSEARIREAFAPAPVLTIANFHFTGLLPDITYLGGMQARTPGPMGDYHSKLTLTAYLAGYTASETVKLFCDEVYQALGYYDEFAAAMAETERRDDGIDIPGAKVLADRIRKGVCFMSQNHPTNMLISAYINQVARQLAARGLAERSGLILRSEDQPNFLAYAPVYPVFPEIARRHETSFPGSYVFRTATVANTPAKALTLPEFIEREFAALKDADQKVLNHQWPGNTLIDRYRHDEALRDLMDRIARGTA